MFSSFNFGDHSIPMFTQFVKKTSSTFSANFNALVKHLTDDEPTSYYTPSLSISSSLQSHIDGEIVFCKNNVCVHTTRPLSKSASNANMSSSQSLKSPSTLSDLSEQHCPGYLCIQEREDAVLGRTLILHWTPNSLLLGANNQLSTTKNTSNNRPVINLPSDAPSIPSTNPFLY